MLPEAKQGALEAKLNSKKALIIEEVGMISHCACTVQHALVQVLSWPKKPMAGDAGTTLCAAQVGLRTDAFEIAPGGFLATSSHCRDVSLD